MQRRSVTRTDPRYDQLRAKNNDSVKKSREKSRRERDETIASISQLEEENRELTETINTLKTEYRRLEDLFRQHTGISIDSLLDSGNNPSTSTTTDDSASNARQEENPSDVSQPVLSINTSNNEGQSSSTSSTLSVSSSSSLDANNLDGAIVLIDGVPYKIVSMNKAWPCSSLDRLTNDIEDEYFSSNQHSFQMNFCSRSDICLCTLILIFVITRQTSANDRSKARKQDFYCSGLMFSRIDPKKTVSSIFSL